MRELRQNVYVDAKGYRRNSEQNQREETFGGDGFTESISTGGQHEQNG